MDELAEDDLYGTCADYDTDVAGEQALAAAAHLIVLLHPIQWYSMPALQKLWLDEVLTYGWAFGTGGTALQGKDLWLRPAGMSEKPIRTPVRERREDCAKDAKKFPEGFPLDLFSRLSRFLRALRVREFVLGPPPSRQIP